MVAKMNICINSATDLALSIKSLNLKPAASIPSVALAILALAFKEEEDSCVIKFNCQVMQGSSYLQAPGMFARSILARSPFPSVQSRMEGKFLVVYAGRDSKPTTFRAKVVAGLKGEGRFEVENEEIPATYRANPSTLGRALALALGKEVRVKFRKTSTIWEIKSK